MLTYEKAVELFDYNPSTGDLLRRVYRASVAAEGDIAGTKNGCGYLQIVVDGRYYLAHRLAWLLYYGEWPKNNLDHINRDRADNRIENLREAGQEENTKNRTLNVNNKSGVCGVCWNKTRSNWMAYISVKGKHKTLGGFDNFDEAVAARLAANKQYGYHENHGQA